MITMANDGDKGDDGADDDCRNHSSSHCRKPRWLPLDEIGDKDKLGRPIMMTRITMMFFLFLICMMMNHFSVIMGVCLTTAKCN